MSAVHDALAEHEMYGHNNMGPSIFTCRLIGGITFTVFHSVPNNRSCVHFWRQIRGNKSLRDFEDGAVCVLRSVVCCN